MSGADVSAARAPQGDERLSVLYDVDWDEDAHLAEWRQVLDRTRKTPLVLRAAALALDAWNDIEVSWPARAIVTRMDRDLGLGERSE